ncbi:hypothetical protein [Breoghania sp.]|uniref:hypothetical protein n=1 Tax=Breoghania sp. TaxID=2065378 RepID=UPI0026161C30|nr:hypothetical protein [Breoghania sp.]MDJ0932214.1 hypothetical protein [Breoghania sp.]
MTACLPTPLDLGTRVLALKVEAGGTNTPRLSIVVDAEGRPATPDTVRAQVASGQVRTGSSFPAQISSSQTAASTQTAQ